MAEEPVNFRPNLPGVQEAVPGVSKRTCDAGHNWPYRHVGASVGGFPVSGNPLFGKFGPIILLGVLQLVLILAVPSTAPNANNSAFGGGNSPGVGSTDPG